MENNDGIHPKRLYLIVLNDEFVVMMSPGEDVVPVAKRVGDERKSVAPRLYDRLHVVERRLTPNVGALKIWKMLRIQRIVVQLPLLICIPYCYCCKKYCCY